MQRNGVQWILLVLALAAAAVLGVFVVRYQRAVRADDAARAEMLAEAEPVEREIAQLRQELSERERALEETSRTPCLMVGFQIEQRSDIDLASRLAEQYGFAPVFVLDPTLRNARDLLDALREVPGELVFSASPCTAETVGAEDLRRSLAEDDARLSRDSGLFLLRNDDDTPEALALVADAGYTGCIRHADAGENTVLDSGLVTLSYSQIKSGGFSVQTRLDKAIRSAQAILFVFDMTAFHDGALTEPDITEALDAIAAARTANGLTFAAVTDASALVRDWTAHSIQSRASFEEYAAATRARIAELEAQLDEIHARWNMGGN